MKLQHLVMFHSIPYHKYFPWCREKVVVDYEATGELLVELGSDQTSLHNPFGGGYYPVQLSFEEAEQVMKDDPPRFKQLVQDRCMFT